MRQVPAAITEFLIHFHGDRDWFECHEILEQYWKEHAGAANADTLVGLIQIAVGLYHERRGNRSGAGKMLRSSLLRLDLRQLRELGLDGERLAERVRARLRQLERGGAAAGAPARADAAGDGAEGAESAAVGGASEAVTADGQSAAFVDLDLPFADSELEAWCRRESEARGWGWKTPSALHNPDLIHRHTRRDRSGVIRERAESARRREQSRAPSGGKGKEELRP